ncbi:MAG: helix-turn-helix domain-containing protein [Shewanella sp.]|uniref:helix-turn-helix domain-containing protein n=1 Tax=Shewanella sp. TaxID=50422 RepID=UPI003F2D2013
MDSAIRPFIRHHNQLISAITLIKRAKTISASLCDTLIAIASHWNPHGDIFPSQERIGALSGIHRRTVITHIKKLIDLNIIATSQRHDAPISQYRASLCYTFNETTLQTLWSQAKQTLRAAARKQRAKLAKTQHAAPQKDHTPAAQKDHIKESFSLRSKDEVKKNTANKKLGRNFSKLILEAVQHELTHLSTLAYTAKTTFNRIRRGEIFSKEENARRAAKADRMKQRHAKAAASVQERERLAVALMTDSAIRPTVNDAMINRLLELVGGEQNLRTAGALLPHKLNSYRQRQRNTPQFSHFASQVG